MATTILFGGFALFLVLNVPIGIAIGLAIMLFIFLGGDVSFQYMTQNLFTSSDSFPLMAIPFFILAGAFMDGGGLSKRLVGLANSLVGHITGGFGMVTVLTCMLFGAISGSSAATVAAIGVIMIPAMVKHGYSLKFSTALIAASGILGVIIPPSIPMVVYGVATGASIGTMFLGGFGPGILCGSLLMSVVYVMAKKRGYKGSDEPFSLKKVLKATGEAKWALLVPVIILGGIYGGIFTPTEAAVVAVFYGFIIGKFVYKELSWEKVKSSLVDTSVTVGTVLIILGTGTTLGKILTMNDVPNAIASWLMSISSDNRYVLLLFMNLILLVVGCVMETMAAILILAPILYAVAAQFGVNIIHFGIIMVLNLAIGFITPPVGVNLFVACGLSKLKLEELSKAIVPFLLSLVASLLLLTVFDDIVMFIPRLFGY